MKGLKIMALAALAIAFVLAVFAPQPAHAVMGQCVEPTALSTVNAAITLCTASANTACVGGNPAANRRHYEIDNGSAIDITANFGVAAVSETGYLIPAGQTRVIFDANNNAALFAQPGTSTGSFIGPTGQLNLIAA